MELCRLCLTLTNQRICVTDNLELIKKIKDTATIEITVEDRHTKFVCLQCIRKIENWYAFKEICLNSKIFLESTPNIENHTDSKPLSQNNEETIQFDDEQCTDTDDQDPLEIKEEQLSPINETSTVYACEFCNREFDYIFDYLDHQETHDGETTWSCTKCKENEDEENQIDDKLKRKRELTNARVKKHRKRKQIESQQLKMQDDPSEEMKNMQIQEKIAERKKALAKERSRRYRERKRLNALKSVDHVVHDSQSPGPSHGYPPRKLRNQPTTIHDSQIAGTSTNMNI